MYKYISCKIIIIQEYGQSIEIRSKKTLQQYKWPKSKEIVVFCESTE